MEKKDYIVETFCSGIYAVQFIEAESQIEANSIARDGAENDDSIQVIKSYSYEESKRSKKVFG